MHSDSEVKEVRFDKYCQSCVNWENGAELCYKSTSVPEAKKLLICDECLETWMRLGTEVPIKWEAK